MKTGETTINWLFIDRILRLQECILDEMLNGGVFELPDNWLRHHCITGYPSLVEMVRMEEDAV